MTHRKDLLDGNPVSFAEALDRSDDILHKVDLPRKQEKFRDLLWEHKGKIEGLVRLHRNSRYADMSESSGWMYGRHSVCIPVCLNNTRRENCVFRVPLPYRVGEDREYGNAYEKADEKVRCEVAIYLWIRKNCPEIPIPHLYGYGFRQVGPFVDHAEFEPTERSRWKTGQRFRRWFGRPPKLPFVEKEPPNKFDIAYMVVDEVTKGNKLSDLLDAILDVPYRRKNFFDDLADIMLRLRSAPMDRIGSLTVRDKTVSIANRPFTKHLAAWDSEGIPTIPREETFKTVESYIMALLECHDNAIRRQGNAIRHLADGQSQLSNILMMRALFNQFTDKRYRNGPFVLTLTNLTTHNIMVDRHGHITSLINLNWACSLPVEMLTPPYWLVDLAADDIDYANLIDDFLDSLRAREKVFPDYHHDSNAAVMRSCLHNGTFWYLRTLTSPYRVCQLFRQHIQGRYGLEDCNHPAFERLASRYWCQEAERFIRRRIQDRHAYCGRLRAFYQPNSLGSPRWRCQKTVLRDLRAWDSPGSSRYDVMML